MNGPEDALARGISAGQAQTRIDAQAVDSDGDRVTFIGDGQTVRTTYAITQLMSASLHSDDAMLDSMTRALIRGHVEQQGLVMVSEPRIAYSFGRFAHAHETGGEEPCTEDCTTIPAEQEDAEVVLMRIEFDVEGGDDDA